MACLGVIRNGGIGDCVNRNFSQRSGSVSGFTDLTISNLAVKLPNHRLSTAVKVNSYNTTTAAFDTVTGRGSALALIDQRLDLRTTKVNDNDFNDYSEYEDRTSIESPRVSEKLDEWIQNSVTEIVKNITQAPLLVQIYADGNVETKTSVPEKNWKNVDNNRSSALDGIILVEELNTDPADSGGGIDGARAFGVLIQGKVKGRDRCKSTCYLLKTSSVNGGGLGHICTHFCLMKVQSFHRNAFSQFEDCWLVRQ